VTAEFARNLIRAPARWRYAPYQDGPFCSPPPAPRERGDPPGAFQTLWPRFSYAPRRDRSEPSVRPCLDQARAKVRALPFAACPPSRSVACRESTGSMR